MGIKYVIDKKNKLITEKWLPKIDLKQFEEAKHKEFNDKDFQPDFNIIADLQPLNPNFDEEIITNILDFIRNNKTKFKNTKIALVVEKPKLVAASLIFKERGKNLSVRINVFSDISSAKEWINETN